MRTTTIKLTFMVTLLGLGALGCEDSKKVGEDATDPTAEAPVEGDEKAGGEDADEKKGAVAKAGGDEKVDEAKDGAEDQGGATVGEPAPDFTLTDQAGEEHELSAYKGKIVVLEWTNPTCPYVERHYKAKTMSETLKAGGEDVVWLAVDSSHTVKPEDTKKWRDEQGFSYPVLLDAEGEVGKTYGAKTTPHMYVIDTEGVLRYSGAIDDDDRGKKEDATNYVAGAVKALKAGEKVEPSETKPYGCSVKYGS